MWSRLCRRNGRLQEPFFLSCSFTTEPEAAPQAFGVKGCVKIQTNLGGCGEVMTAAQTLLCIKLKMQVLASQRHVETNVHNPNILTHALGDYFLMFVLPGLHLEESCMKENFSFSRGDSLPRCQPSL